MADLATGHRKVETVGIEPTGCSSRRTGGFARGVPVYQRGGGIRAFAMLDAEDAERLGQFRWCFDNDRWRLVKRVVTRGGKPTRLYLHRKVLGLAPGDSRRVDHINRDTLDNRKANLRVATDAQNAQNQGSRGGSSQYRGVTWDKSRKKWLASHQLDGKRTTIGRFDTELEAAEAAARFRAERMPFSQEAGVA